MIRLWNSAYKDSNERWIKLNEVTIHAQGICEFTGRPYIQFEHPDFPLGALTATHIDNVWDCDLN